MLITETIEQFKLWRAEQNGTVALVPTMGALHEGHLSLIRKAKKVADKVVLYIFVNPMQFGPKEDFGSYPRTLEKDFAACQKEGVDVVFTPDESQIYPQGKENCTKVVPPAFLADILEGHFRPGFFTGVATVLIKFFSIVQPSAVIFGEKDYQQLLIVRRIVQDLNLPITVYGAPLVREPDGLAMSSRNAYLNEQQRKLAPRIHEFLEQAADKIEHAQSKSPEEISHLLKSFAQKFQQSGFELQYLEGRDAETLQPVNLETQKIILLVAAKLNNIRLIDNLFVSSKPG